MSDAKVRLIIADMIERAALEDLRRAAEIRAQVQLERSK